MFDTNILFSSIIFGSIGMGYFIYGKKDKKYNFLLSGILLMIYPYFINNIYFSIGVGILILIFPFFIKF